jgi:hypothetical protein
MEAVSTKAKGYGAPILIRAFERASGLVVWKKRKKTVPMVSRRRAAMMAVTRSKASPAMMKKVNAANPSPFSSPSQARPRCNKRVTIKRIPKAIASSNHP